MQSGAPSPVRSWAVSSESLETIAGKIAGVALDRSAGRAWWLAFLVGLGLLGVFTLSLGWLLIQGVGIWGNNIPVTWALDIISYDWWIGVASGGLMVSALLLLLRQEWRGALNRAAETTALLSAAAAALYPIIHLGRPWFFYWNLPYPNTMLLWPQFRSPLFWDAMAIVSYLIVGLSFWYVGMLPDLATLRDRSGSLAQQRIYGILALGWRGSATHWLRWRQAYRSLAALAIMLVVALQSGAAVMFAGSLEPGWHDTMLPVLFLMGSLLSGVAVVAIVLVALRALAPLRPLITGDHLAMLAWLLLALGVANLYCYATEFFVTTLKGERYEMAVMARRLAGPDAWSFWLIVACALVPVHLFWFAALRRSPAVLAAVGLLVAIGMWADRFMIIVITLQHDFLPSAAHPYGMDVWGLATYAGSIGLFLVLLLLFMRFLPTVSILELRRLATSRSVGTGDA